MADTTVRGRFVWHELMTPDASSAHSFYTKVLGWKTQTWEQDRSYTMFVAPSGPLAGTWETPAGAPHWLPYIGTPDIAATLEQARALGARVSKDVTGMSNGGQYAVLDDPQGAAFGIYQSASVAEPQGVPKRGEYSWHELATSDYRAAFDFYSALFGWERAGEHDMGDMGMYFMFGLDGVATGGMFNRPADMPGGPAWAGYVRVKDVHQTADKVTASGGTLLQGPMEVPGGDWIAQFSDPQGAPFSVHTLAVDLKAAEAAAMPSEDVAAAAGTQEDAGAAQAAPRRRRRSVKKPAAASKPARKKSSGKKAAKTTAKKASSKKASKKTSKRPAKKSAARAAKTSARKSAKKSARKTAKKAAKKAGAKTRRKTTAPKRGAAGRTAKRPARKTAKTGKKAVKRRSGAKKRAAKRARKAK